MGKYDFDRIIDRTGTSSLKYDFGLKRKGRDDLLPMWVADMDFALPDEVLEPVIDRVRHGIFGYTDPDEAYLSALTGWFERHHGYRIDPEWIDITPGVVFGIGAAIRAFTDPGDGVIIQQPVYYPFSETIWQNGRRIVNSQLHYEDGRYTMDYEDFEHKVVSEDIHFFILCNPHNPVGRVWTRDELERIADICNRHDVIVFADEIHCDFTYRDHTYIPFASLGEEVAARTITGTSASKTFNLAGLQVSNIITSDPELKKKLRLAIDASGYSQGNTLGMVATQTAYDRGEDWYRELITYLTGNRDFLRTYIDEHIPGVRLVEPEGTYLIWLDCSDITSDHHELEHLVVDVAGLWLDPGIIFGRETALFERINIACPRPTLTEGLRRLADAFDRRA